MEGLGEKLKKARTARNLTLDEAARMTKIRPNKLAEIEAEDFSNFPSLAYAKGFVLIYGKFLSVDVSPYLAAFETSEHVTVDGYSYLQDNPAPPPRRTEIVRREPAGGRKSSLMPLAIAVVVMIGGFWLLKLMMDIRRIKPAGERDAQALAQRSPSRTAQAFSTAGAITAPRALPPGDEASPPAVAQGSARPLLEPGAAPVPAVTTPPGVAVAPAPPQPAATAPSKAEPEPEIRRAEPVHPDDLKKAQAAMAAVGAPAALSPGVNRFEIRPLKKTFVKAVVDYQPGGGGGGFERWLDVSTGAVQLSGQRITVKVLDPSEIEIRKNGKVVSGRDADVTLQ